MEEERVTEKKGNDFDASLLEKMGEKRAMASVIAALRLNGDYPVTTNKDFKRIPDRKFIDRTEKCIPKGDKILFAYYGNMQYDESKKLKELKDGTRKVSLLNSEFMILIVTDHTLVLVRHNDEIAINKDTVIDVKYVFKRTFTTVGQVQVEFNNGFLLLFSVNLNESTIKAQDWFDSFKSLFSSFFDLKTAENVTCTEEDKKKESVSKRKCLRERFSLIINSAFGYPDKKINKENRYMIHMLLLAAIAMYDQYLNAEPSSEMEIYLLVGEVLLNSRINALLSEPLFAFDHIDYEMLSESVIETIEDCKQMLNETIDDLVLEKNKNVK